MLLPFEKIDFYLKLFYESKIHESNRCSVTRMREKPANGHFDVYRLEPLFKIYLNFAETDRKID